MSAPSVSIIIPAYNRASLLRDALESVRRQTFREPLEVIVVDDGSTDDTEAVILPYLPWVTYIRQKNQGVAAARNTGILKAVAPYIAFLDSDDIWLPHKLERQMEFLRQKPETGLLYARMWSYDVETPDKKRLEPRMIARTFEDLLNGPNCITTSTVIVRKGCFETAGLFDPTLPAVEDHELWLRIAKRFLIDFLDEPVAEYRRHKTSTTSEPVRLYEGYRRFYESILKQYRQEMRDPRSAERQLAKFEYLCGTAALKGGKAKEAFRLISRAISRDACLGTQFRDEKVKGFSGIFLPLKPYAVLTVSALRAIG
ncbi:MAG: glycosyltransferase [Candidatus Omnitrophica bacterium]|nr:glycosyltransferase [Candidatus Omnitrophota bacterium]